MIKKYYCPKKWYRNIHGVVPCAGEVAISVVLGYQKDLKDSGNYMSARVWRWDKSEYLRSDIVYFRVKTRTPKLVENPSVQLHEMFQPRNG